MNKKSQKTKRLLFLPILFLCTFALFFINAFKKKTPTPAEKAPESQTQEAPKVVMPSWLAGTWYPADAKALTKQLDAFFEKADVKPIDNVIALILPHAGYSFSGQTATCGLKAINKKYKRVVVIGPAHRVPMQEVLSVPRATHYETPLGQIPLDTDFINRLLEFPVFQNIPRAFEYENSIEMELPLLQHHFQSFTLVPIAAGHCSPQTVAKAGKILKSLIDPETLIVASSDFTHYGASYGYVPFTENIPEQIKNLDMGAYEHIKALDYKGFLGYCGKTGATICGRIPIAILLSMAEKPTEAHLIKYTTSGEMEGNYTRSVSYLVAAFSGIWQNSPPIEPQAANPEITEQDKKQLLTLARKSLLYAIKHRRIPQEADLDIPISDAMKEPRAAFVTLKKNHQLRGCIGDIFPQRPLYTSVITNAINAAVNDRRFLPVTLTECNDITIEISALTAPSPIDSPNEIRIGIDGVVLSKDSHSAVFLPQVATEQGWGLDQMLTQLSQKAKLPPDAWKQDASFLVFQAVIFGEEEK